MRQSVNSGISSSIFVPACGKDKPLWCSLLKLSLGDWSAWGCSLHNAGGYWKAPAWLKITFYDSDTWPTGFVFYSQRQGQTKLEKAWWFKVHGTFRTLVTQASWRLGWIYIYNHIHIYIYICHIKYMIYIHMACIYISLSPPMYAHCAKHVVLLHQSPSATWIFTTLVSQAQKIQASWKLGWTGQVWQGWDKLMYHTLQLRVGANLKRLTCVSFARLRICGCRLSVQERVSTPAAATLWGHLLVWRPRGGPSCARA